MGGNSFNILSVSGSEMGHLENSGLHVNKITDPDSQLKLKGLAPGVLNSPVPVGYVQDTPDARRKLAEGHFVEEMPAFNVVPESVAGLKH